jgi:hypothetical protein
MLPKEKNGKVNSVLIPSEWSNVARLAHAMHRHILVWYYKIFLWKWFGLYENRQIYVRIFYVKWVWDFRRTASVWRHSWSFQAWKVWRHYIKAAYHEWLIDSETWLVGLVKCAKCCHAVVIDKHKKKWGKEYRYLTDHGWETVVSCTTMSYFQKNRCVFSSNVWQDWECDCRKTE